ncbi:hypothetical protein VAZ01S_047_00040 [Vibrio azureus NBRC 104587]|uniref:BIG2 domain-containing protein n=2 Tax=Vibrio azureus TaxID=512649 RepID=U3A9G8_9VIBR|nr:Ig-like domain-containing protein [Vibrio azureus]GAD76591.1 hypothetical protein VAZ01S_047_00040 [Vibrio azureus NBRC 104587]
MQVFKWVIFFIPLSFILGCLEVGENQGSLKVMLSGSLLKGVVRNADIKVINEKNVLIWQGESNNNGLFEAEYALGQGSIFTLISDLSIKGSMQCDSVFCYVPNQNEPYKFDEDILNEDLGSVALKTAWYQDSQTDMTGGFVRETQLNGLSTLVVNLVENELGHPLDQQKFDALSKVGSDIVLELFGFESNLDLNMLNLSLPNVKEITDKMDEEFVLLSLINAAISSNISYLSLFTQQESFSEEFILTAEMRTLLSEIRVKVLLAANDLITSPYIPLKSPSIGKEINKRVVEPIDFSRLSALFENLASINRSSARRPDEVLFINTINQEFTYGSQPFLASANSSSGRPVTYSSSNEQVATIKEGMITIIGSGTATISASVSEDEDYLAAMDAFTLVVSKALNPIPFPFSQLEKTFGEKSFFLPSIINDGDDRSIEYFSSNHEVATVDPVTGEVMIKGTGSTTISARVEEDNRYFAATDNFILKVNKANKREPLPFSELEKIVGDTDFVLPSIVTNEDDRTVRYHSSNHSVAVVDSETGKVTLKGAGTTIITMSVNENEHYLAIRDTLTLIINKETSTVPFPYSHLEKTFGDVSFTLPKTTPVGDNRAIQYVSSNHDVAVVDSEKGSVIIQGAGTTLISASVNENERFLAAEETLTLTVKRAVDQASFPIAKIEKTFGDKNFVLPSIIKSSEGGIVQYFSLNHEVALVNVDSGEVSINGAGKTKILATISGRDNYHDIVFSDDVSVEIDIAKADRIATFSQPFMAGKKGDSFIQEVLVDGSVSEITYISSDPSVVLVDQASGQVSLLKPGTATVTGTVTEEANWNPAYADYSVYVYSKEVNDTGLTRCFDHIQQINCGESFIGQDAEYGRDVSTYNDHDGYGGFSFAKLDSQGKVINEDVDTTVTEWSCVLDLVTGLRWQVKKQDGSVHSSERQFYWFNDDQTTNGGKEGTKSDSNHLDSQDYVTLVNESRLCGAENWRLPTVIELSSLINFGTNGLKVDHRFFPTINNGIYWTFNSFLPDSDDAWYISFSTGHSSYRSKTNTANYLILVSN